MSTNGWVPITPEHEKSLAGLCDMLQEYANGNSPYASVVCVLPCRARENSRMHTCWRVIAKDESGLNVYSMLIGTYKGWLHPDPIMVRTFPSYKQKDDYCERLEQMAGMFEAMWKSLLRHGDITMTAIALDVLGPDVEANV